MRLQKQVNTIDKNKMYWELLFIIHGTLMTNIQEKKKYFEFVYSLIEEKEFIKFKAIVESAREYLEKSKSDYFKAAQFQLKRTIENAMAEDINIELYRIITEFKKNDTELEFQRLSVINFFNSNTFYDNCLVKIEEITENKSCFADLIINLKSTQFRTN